MKTGYLMPEKPGRFSGTYKTTDPHRVGRFFAEARVTGGRTIWSGGGPMWASAPTNCGKKCGRAGDREGRPYGGLQAVRCKPGWRGEGTPPYGGNVGADAPVRLVRRGKSLSAAMKTNIPRRLGRRGMLVYHFFMTQTVTAPLGYIVIRDRFPFMVVFREI